MAAVVGRATRTDAAGRRRAFAKPRSRRTRKAARVRPSFNREAIHVTLFVRLISSCLGRHAAGASNARNVHLSMFRARPRQELRRSSMAEAVIYAVYRRVIRRRRNAATVNISFFLCLSRSCVLRAVSQTHLWCHLRFGCGEWAS